jgi:hypothetical protein
MIASNAHQNRQARQDEVDASTEVVSKIAPNDYEQLQVERSASNETARKPPNNYAELLDTGEKGCNA